MIFWIKPAIHLRRVLFTRLLVLLDRGKQRCSLCIPILFSGYLSEDICCVCFEGKDIREIGYTRYRNSKIGIVFQAYNLLPYLTPLENVLAAMEITSNPIKNKKERARELLTRMGITEDQMKRNINKLSGGEQQRVAIARAISTNAEVILADEPTGNLDVDTAAGIVKIFKELAHEDKKCVIAVTHSEAFAAEADVVVRLEKKKLQD